MHAPLSQILAVAQATQLDPPAPQAAAVVPGWQAPALTQPVQQVPPAHFPPVHAVPSAAAWSPQVPAWHSGVLQGSALEQAEQAPPAAPHWLVVVPA